MLENKAASALNSGEEKLLRKIISLENQINALKFSEKTLKICLESAEFINDLKNKELNRAYGEIDKLRKQIKP